MYNQIMKQIRQNLFEISAIILISIIYIISRIFNLLHLPIFTDEAIYIRWAQIAQNDAAWRFISLTDGKQPSFIWAQLVTQKIFYDPLVAGRMVSVFAGFGTLIGVFVLTQVLFSNKKMSLLASFLYLIFPFALVYDRLAIYDSMVAMFFVWSLVFGVLLIKHLRLDLALIFGFILGGSVLTKSSGFLTIYLFPLFLLLFNLSRKGIGQRFLKWILLFGVSVFLAYAIYSIQRLSPFFYIIEQKNATFVYPFSEWISHPFTYLSSNLLGLVDWLLKYMTLPMLGLSISSFIFLYKQNFKEKAFLFLWFLGPFLALAVFGKLIYPRFIFFMTIPLLILSSYSLIYLLGKVKSLYLKIAIMLIFTCVFIYADFKILTDFKNAPIPRIDLEQFVNGWPAGGGVNESIKFFEEEAQDKKIIIATEGTFGLMPYSYEIFLNKNPNIEIRSYWPIKDTLPEDIVKDSSERDVYFVFYQPCPACDYPGAAPISWGMEKIKEYKKGDGSVSLSIYKVLSSR